MQHGFPCRYRPYRESAPTVRYAIPNNVRLPSSDPSFVKRAHRSPMFLPDRPRPRNGSPRPTVLCSDRRVPVYLCQAAHPFQLVARAVDHGGKIKIGGGNLSAADQTRGAEMAQREGEPRKVGSFMNSTAGLRIACRRVVTPCFSIDLRPTPTCPRHRRARLVGGGGSRPTQKY